MSAQMNPLLSYSWLLFFHLIEWVHFGPHKPTTWICDERYSSSVNTLTHTDNSVKTERDTTLVQYYIYFLQWILVAIQEVSRIWGGRGKEECSYRKILSLFISVISWLYDDLVAQNYSNIENMNTSLCTNYRKHLSLYEDLIKE